MPIFEKDKTIFIHIPKTGGTSITRKFLIEYNDFKHYDFIFYKNFLKEKIYDYKLFTVVRNPYDRIISYFSMHLTQSPFLKEKIYSKKPHNLKEAFKIYIDLTIKENILTTLNKRPFLVYRSQSSFLVDENNNVNKDIKIIKYENLNREILFLPRINVKTIDIKSSDVFTDEIKSFIENYFIEDFKNFEYNTEL